MDIASWLDSCALFPTTLSEAYDVLRLVDSMIEYNEVLAVFFPVSYQYSCNLIEEREESLFPPSGQAYAPREVRLLESLHATLCPLGNLQEHLEEEATPDGRWYTIPLVSLGFDELYEEMLEYEIFENDLSLGWCLMLYLCGVLEEEFFDGMEPLEEGATHLFAMKIEQGFADGGILHAECQKQQGPLVFFEQALDMVGHTTGTPFLDTTSQYSGRPVPMTPASLRQHVEHYHMAVRIKEQAEQFIHWIEEKPVEHFMEVIELWNSCMMQTRSKAEREKALSTPPTG